MLPNPENENRPLAGVEVLLLDVDGVLTQGQITYDDLGREIKTFCVKDGLGLRLLMDAGLEVGIVTGRASDALRHRCDNLGIQHLWDGVKDKAALVDQISEKLDKAPENMAFMGDDLPDLPIMARVGTALAPGDAHPMVRERADWVAVQPGGQGAVREVCEAILRARGLWDQAVEKFLRQS